MTIGDLVAILVVIWFTGVVVSAPIAKASWEGDRRDHASAVAVARAVFWPLWLLLTLIRGVRHL